MSRTVLPLPPEPTLAVILAELREVRGELREAKLELHQLKVVVRTKVETPSDSLTVKQVVKRLRMSERNFRRLLARRLFTDARGEKASGAHWKLFSDEIEEYRLRGEDGLAAFRERVGRA